MIVLIDDERDFRVPVPGNLVVLRNSREALEWFDNHGLDGKIDQLWLDHDLGLDNEGNPDDIMGVLLPLMELNREGYFPDIGEVLVHTANPVGAANIIAALEGEFPYPVHRVRAQDYLTVLPRG